MAIRLGEFRKHLGIYYLVLQRATQEELELIKSHLATKPDVPLDRPEQFLYDLSEIPNFAERISCFMFQAEFEDSINTIEHTLTNIKTTCEVTNNNKNHVPNSLSHIFSSSFLQAALPSKTFLQ